MASVPLFQHSVCEALDARSLLWREMPGGFSSRLKLQRLLGVDFIFDREGTIRAGEFARCQFLARC